METRSSRGAVASLDQEGTATLYALTCQSIQNRGLSHKLLEIDLWDSPLLYLRIKLLSSEQDKTWITYQIVQLFVKVEGIQLLLVLSTNKRLCNTF